MFECITCDAVFWDQDDCDEHMDDERHWIECETCNRSFRTQNACNQHMNAVDHWAPTFDCETCNSTFRTQHAANNHMNAKSHWLPKVPCETCPMKFYTQQAVENHMSAKGHYKNYCQECSRQFMNANCLRQHLNSKIHRGTNIACPFCRVGFVTASGVSHHLESGACPQAQGLNRDRIHRIIQQLDPNGIVCKKQIAWHGEHEQDMTYLVTDNAWNGSCWVCYLCKKGFNSPKALGSHVNSPVHNEKVYHCLKRGCPKEFHSLASLFNHLESESCGFIRFEGVQQVHRQLNDAIMGRRTITGF
ncbi:transcriptional regulator family: C2H2 zinc finger [Penicillium roqueforti]|nr:transcriptional regulator family: C2H2 zinc finger [Penicillium roqueforti]KAI2673555.1 transcriptional regulator family: C2H2 zinc finger [Penicillium roqueforti]KAI2704682.1 transcriptional regulator family: C2H2 zinc finger [Penicillium roqueforti]KAI3105380.1 transcriptional regulator family: C2H2 zinc finger [Penicillium roqueforti]KAI3160725.1 transcriptional regulator family: C2H2 zinc finger [Penicillium roqueforti]